MSFKKIFRIIFILLVISGIYYERASIMPPARSVLNYYFPCSLPITYSLGTFDERFGITRERFLAHLMESEKAWENAAQKELFTYREQGGSLTINLVYDDRQETTHQLNNIHELITGKHTIYDQLVTQYTILSTELNKKQQTYTTDIERIKELTDMYQKEVQKWNELGGAPATKYHELERKRVTINTQVSQFNNSLGEYNETVEKVEKLSSQINALVGEIQINTQKYNTTRTNNGEEFSEGEFMRKLTGTHINIYEFADETKLSRVLTHEMGHALGLHHVDDTDALMYRSNVSKNKDLTRTDINELNRVCGL